MRARLLAVAGVLVAFGLYAGPALASPAYVTNCPWQPGHTYVTSCQLTFSGNSATGTETVTATFTVAPGATVTLSLASYTKSGPVNAVTYPQQVFESATGTFSTGTYRLTVGLPACSFWQVDFVRGSVKQTLTGEATAYPAEHRLLAWALGQSAGCGSARTPGFWKNHASCSASNGNQAFVLDQTLARAGGTIMIGDLAVDTCLEAVRVLDKSTVNTGANMASHPAYNLAAHLLAAKLNVVAGATTCANVSNAINQAQALLDAVNYTGTGSPMMTAAQASKAGTLASILDRYNNNDGSVC
ncbi:MAG: hypothetical protein ABR583_11690 [Gaiellaceae bacterium]